MVSQDMDAIEELRARGVPVVYSDPARLVLAAANIAQARVIIVTERLLMDKMRICLAARAANVRIVVIAAAGTAAERAWLEEFGAEYVCDALDEVAEALMRSVRNAL